MEASLRGRMEQRLGHDFGDVRFHTGPTARQAADSVDGHAFTFGRHVVLGSGNHSPDTAEGFGSIAHELAHVVQQSRGGPGGSLAPLENSAERAAAVATTARGSTTAVEIGGASPVGVARRKKDRNPRHRDPDEIDERREQKERKRSRGESRSAARRERAQEGKSELQLEIDTRAHSERALQKMEEAPRPTSERKRQQATTRFERHLAAQGQALAHGDESRAKGQRLKQNIRKGDYVESLVTPKGAKTQQVYVGGGPQLPGQEIRRKKDKHTRPDYTYTRKTAEGGPERVHVNVKSDKIHLMKESTARTRAQGYNEQATKNKAQLPEKDKLVIRYLRRPSPEIRSAMLEEHFGANKHISAVQFGSQRITREEWEKSQAPKKEAAEAKPGRGKGGRGKAKAAGKGKGSQSTQEAPTKGSQGAKKGGRAKTGGSGQPKPAAAKGAASPKPAGSAKAAPAKTKAESPKATPGATKAAPPKAIAKAKATAKGETPRATKAASPAAAAPAPATATKPPAPSNAPPPSAAPSKSAAKGSAPSAQVGGAHAEPAAPRPTPTPAAPAPQKPSPGATPTPKVAPSPHTAPSTAPKPPAPSVQTSPHPGSTPPSLRPAPPIATPPPARTTSPPKQRGAAHAQPPHPSGPGAKKGATGKPQSVPRGASTKPGGGGATGAVLAKGAQVLTKGLNAYDAYKEYDRLRKEGVSPQEAIAKSGAQLLAPSEMAAFDEYQRLRKSEHSQKEAVAGALGGYLGTATQTSTPTGIAVNLLNRVAHTAGAPQEVTDATTVGANVVNFQAQVVKEGARSWVNIYDAIRTGDTKAIERQVEEWKGGDTPLAGYAMMTDIGVDLLSGKSFDQAVSKAAKAGQGSILARAGNFMGDVVFADVTAVSSMVDDLKSGKDFKTARKNARQKIYDSMGSNNSTIKSVEKINESVNKATDWVENKAEQVSKKVDQATGWVGEKVDKTGEWVGEKVDKAETWAAEKLDKAAGKVEAASDWVSDKAASAWKSLW